MNQEERTELLSRLGSGDITFRDLAQLTARDVQAIAYLGRVAMETSRFDQAVTIFRGLEALEKDKPEHSLYLAYAQAEAKDERGAIKTIERYLYENEALPAEDVVRALLLRARLMVGRDPKAAELDVKAASDFSQRSPEARKAFEEMGR